MNQFRKSVMVLFAVLLCGSAFADNYERYNLTITMLRTVGNYSAGTLYDNTVEVHFTPAVTWPAGSPCVTATVVIIDKNDQHLISAAYMAFAAGKKIHFNVDTTLPIRGSTCQISFLDVAN